MSKIAGYTIHLLVFVVTFAVYVSFRTRHFYWDGVEFARQIEANQPFSANLIHPNHLIYNVVGSFFYFVGKFFAPELRALDALQILNCLFGAAAVAVFYDVLRRLFAPNLAICLSFLFAFSATWWKFATDANAYTPSGLFLIFCFALLRSSEQKPRPVALAALHLAAMCFHQLAIFFFPVIVAGVYWQSNRENKWKNVGLYMGAVALLTGAAFGAGFYANTGKADAASFARWLTNYSTEHGFALHLWNNLTFTLRGHTRLFFDGRFNFVQFWVNPWTTALFGMWAALVGWLIFKLGRDARDFHLFFGKIRRAAQNSFVVWLCVIWAAVYLAFLFFFIPQNTFYRLFYLPALIVLIGVVISAEWKSRERFALFVVVAAIANFLFFIEPYSRVRSETPLLMSSKLNRVWTRETVVYYFAPNSDGLLIEYFNRETTWRQLNFADFKFAVAEIAATRAAGKDVWLDYAAIETLAKTAEGAQWLEENAITNPDFKINDPAYKVKFAQVK